MSAGVQYNINVVTGNSNSALDGVITLLRESVVQTTAISAAVQQFSTNATNGLSNVEAAVNTLSGDIRNHLTPPVAALPTQFTNAATGANTLNNSLAQLGNRAFSLNNIRQALDGMVSDLNNAVQPGIDFNKQMAETQAISGATDGQMKQISTTSRELAKDYGVSAAGIADSNKLILSQLGPDLAQVPEALTEMTRQAVLASKQMGGDVAGATNVLTTAMNQFGVSTQNPIQAAKTMAAMNNIMAAAAKEGSAELPQLAAGLQVVGGMAKTANVSFAETNSALELLDKTGHKGAEGGTALRNAIAIFGEKNFMHPRVLEMLKEAGVDMNKLSNQSLPFSERLGALKPIVGSVADMTALFGRENVAAGIALVQGSGSLHDFTTKITGTNTATDIATTVMGSYAEKQAVAKSKIDDVGISIFNVTSGFLPYIQFGMTALGVTANIAQSMSLFSLIAKTKMWSALVGGITQMGIWITTTASAAMAQWGWNAALVANPIGVIVVAIVAAVAAVWLLIKNWDTIWGAIKAFGIWVWEHSPFGWLIEVTEKIFPGFKKAMGELWEWVVGKFKDLLDWFKKAGSWIAGLFGGSKDAASDASKAAVETYVGNMKRDLPGVIVPGVAPDPNAVIPGITAPGDANNQGVLKDFDPHHKKGKKDKEGKGTSHEMASNVSSGGSRPTTINLTIHKLQDQIVVHTTNLQMGAKEAGDKIVEQILMALNSVNAKGVASNG